MGVEATQFDNDYFEFRQSVQEIERRLGAVICLGLDDCTIVYGKLQLLKSFDDETINRSIIKEELESKLIGLIHAFGHDLKTVQEIFIVH